MSKTISTDATINSIRLKEQASAPDTPASGFFQVYAKTDGKLYYKNDAGTEVCLSDALVNPMTTAGDIIYGGVSGAPTRLAAGTEDQVLTMGATNPEWAAASAGGSSEILLNYAASTDLFDNTALTADTWTDIIANQNFTVSSVDDVIAISAFGSVRGGNASGFAVVQIVVDSGGTPVTKQIGFTWINATTFENFMCGTSVFYLTGLSAGTHTVKLQMRSNQTAAIYLRASSVPLQEFLSVQVIKL